jgi:hypothetical protein
VHFVNGAALVRPPLTLRTVWVPNVNARTPSRVALTLCTPSRASLNAQLTFAGAL